MNVRTLETLAAQTLALSYKTSASPVLVPGYGGQTVAVLGCEAYLSGALTAAPFGLSASSSVEAARAAANT